MILLNLQVSKKGRVIFAEIFDSNVLDSNILDSILFAVKSNGFTPLFGTKQKIIKETALVLMEISAPPSLLITLESDTFHSNKSITAARFLGGQDLFNRYISDQFIYPARCIEESIGGYVRIRFMVDRNGIVSRCTIKEYSKACAEFTDEANRVLFQCPKWIPAQFEGKNIAAWFEVPLSFKASK